MDIESEEGIRSVVLRRNPESSGMGLGLGFSIMGGAGYEFPPVIYGIELNSPAAISGMLEAGDVILSINEREVVKLSTKEVLKCLRLSGDIVHIKFKRDPHVVSRVRHFLSTPNYLEQGSDNHILHHQQSPLKHSNKIVSSSPSAKKGSQIPVYNPNPTSNQYQNQSSPSHHNHPQIIHHSSPSRNATSGTPYSQQTHHHPPPTIGPGGDHVDHAISLNSFSNNKLNSGGPNHPSSFSDELFINHSFQQVLHSPSKGNQQQQGYQGQGQIVPANKVQAHIHILQDKQHPSPHHHPHYQHHFHQAQSQTVVATSSEHSQSAIPKNTKNGQRKNFETFVMTGDAILSKDLSKNDSNDLYKASPTKTTSKLSPMPHLPIFVERDKDYNRRVMMMMEKENQKDKDLKEKDKSESENSPPLPSPPPPAPADHRSGRGEGGNNSNNSYSSDKNKSDGLPLPPPPLLPLQTESEVNKNGHNGVNGSNHHNGQSANNPTSANRCPLQHSNSNNNEDTSISSSVMSSDSGDDDILDGDDPAAAAAVASDVKNVVTAQVPNSSNNSNGNTGDMSGNNGKVPLGMGIGRKSTSVDSYDPAAAAAEEKGSSQEKERYAEYILFNGSRGTLSEDDYSAGRTSCSGATVHNNNSYAQAINRTTPTAGAATTSTGGGQNNSRDHSASQSPSDEDRSDRDLDLDEESNSENDIIGAGYDKLGGSHGLSNNDHSFSGGESDSSDVESMRVAPVTKAVDVPSAERLAKRLFALDGFKASDVWRQLSKNTDFNRVVATEYLNFFTFGEETLDVSLRKFLAVCPLRGETQDRERVLSYFSARYVENNPDTFGSQDSVHTLACAIMLLNTDMYSGLRSQRMTCSEFIENLQGLNDGGDFPRDVLKSLYLSIRSQPLVSPSDADDEDSNKDVLPLDPPVGSTISLQEFKRGYLVRKCTHEFGGKKTPLGKRSWKMFFCRLKELLLVLSTDETTTTTTPPTTATNKSKKSSKNSTSSSSSPPPPPPATPAPPLHQIKLHHAFAAMASDYRKRKNVLRIILADRSQFLFQSSDAREMHSWIDMINWNAARFSSPALEAPCSSSGRFEKPLLPSAVSRNSRREQASIHQAAVFHWEKELEILAQPKKKGSSNLKKDEKEKLVFYQYEIRRYRTYLEILEKRANSENSERNGEVEQLVELQVLPNPPVLMEEES